MTEESENVGKQKTQLKSNEQVKFYTAELLHHLHRGVRASLAQSCCLMLTCRSGQTCCLLMVKPLWSEKVFSSPVTKQMTQWDVLYNLSQPKPPCDKIKNRVESVLEHFRWPNIEMVTTTSDPSPCLELPGESVYDFSGPKQKHYWYLSKIHETWGANMQLKLEWAGPAWHNKDTTLFNTQHHKQTFMRATKIFTVWLEAIEGNRNWGEGMSWMCEWERLNEERGWGVSKGPGGQQQKLCEQK